MTISTETSEEAHQHRPVPPSAPDWIPTVTGAVEHPTAAPSQPVPMGPGLVGQALAGSGLGSAGPPPAGRSGPPLAAAAPPVGSPVPTVGHLPAPAGGAVPPVVTPGPAVGRPATPADGALPAVPRWPVAGTGWSAPNGTAAVGNLALAGFQENPFALRRTGPIGPPPTPKRGRRPFLRLLVVAAVAGGAVVGWRLTRPSVHASPTAVALAFYQQLGRGDTAAAIADVEPSQQTAASSSLRSAAVASFAAGALRSGVLEPATTSADAVGVAVVLQQCRSNLSCSPVLTVPTVQVAGAWYVDLNTWLQSVPPPSAPNG